MPTLRYLSFDVSESGDGVTTLEAMAATPAADAARHEAVMAEVQQVLDWASHHFPHAHGPVDDGHHWQHDLQLTAAPDSWRTVTLTLSASPMFAAEFLAAFATLSD